ncbi:MAG: thiamine pyrophosphate-binding protein [Sphaerochaeta sp.]|nr:thiamine pyrophosphate-binding protein [Sphaerochaeta sp.]
MEQEMTFANYLTRFFREQGVKHIFGVPSGDWMSYMEAMESGDPEFVLVANEASGGFMATVYGWLTGAPGVCYGTTGPGATNLSTGVGCALLDRSPLIALTTEPPEHMVGRTTQMVIDHQTLFKPVTKHTFRMQLENVERQLVDAVTIAKTEVQGPVHIGLPEGMGDKLVTAAFPPVIEPDRIPAPSKASLAHMEVLIAKARKPLLAIGLSAVRLGLGEAIVKVAQHHDIPVVLTPMAKGLIDEDHRCYAGVLFHALSDIVALTNNQADLVVGVGYDPVEFNYESWMPIVPLVHIDTTACDIDTNVYRDVHDVVGHPAVALDRLLSIAPVASAWDMEALRVRREDMFARFVPKPGVFGPLSVLQILREILPDDGIMTCDVGAHTHLIGQAWRTRHPFGQLMTNGWSSMGFGIPAALGAKLARPETPVVCITGDGGYMMMAGEMATAQRIGKNIVFIVLSDTKLELIRLKQKKRGRITEGTTLSNVQPQITDYMFGVPILPADSAQAFRAALTEAFACEGPVIVQAIIDSSEYEDLILRKHK